ncbi:MAG: WG repeat-containing protein, partial [Clostridia bacterium]|nr:WG repeat-containing protein [Clostridia bacterium]
MGQKAIDCTYNYAGSFSNGLALVCNEKNKVGYINTSGEYVIEPQYDLFYSDKKIGFDFSDDGYVIVIKNNKFGVIDKEGNVVLECKYDGLAGNSLSK